MTDTVPPTFTQLIDNPALLKVLNEVGYEHPTPIQAETIPLIAVVKMYSGRHKPEPVKLQPLLCHY